MKNTKLQSMSQLQRELSSIDIQSMLLERAKDPHSRLEHLKVLFFKFR